MKTLIVTSCLLGSLTLALAQSAAPARINPADAKNHVGDNATVCGKVVENKVSRYGIANHGKPVSFYLDQPEANAVFYFVTFGAQPDGPKEAVTAYQDKHVCVTGKITVASSGPFIMAADRSQIKTDAVGK